MQYPVFFENSTIGEIQVRQEGLYYHFTCSCTPPDNGIYRIVISCENAEQNLGICVPEGMHFGLSKRVPVKHLKGGAWKFYLRPKDAENSIMVAVSEERPFPLLDKLDSSALTVKNGEAFIAIRAEE
ncbi:MAG: hypothetical protein IKJ94_00415 [Oscillospiraceae bacterium]|nr:hypothetical protein [Oscillospiraceae bacterium]